MEKKFAGECVAFLKSEEVLGKAPSIGEIISLWKEIMNNAGELRNVAVADVPFSNDKTNGLVAVSNGLFKYHFYLKPNNDNTKFVLRLENWDEEYERKKISFLTERRINTTPYSRKNAGMQTEYRLVFEVEISKEEYLEIYNITKEFRGNMVVEIDAKVGDLFGFGSVKI